MGEQIVQTTVTRTERRVHKTPDAAEPVVDERTVTRVVRDNATVEEVVSERQSLPLNDFERDHWMRNPDEEPEAEALFHNSREAMVLNDFEETPEGVIERQTLITQHVVPEAMSRSEIQHDVREQEEREGSSTQVVDSSPEQLPAPHFEAAEGSSDMEKSATGLLRGCIGGGGW